MIKRNALGRGLGALIDDSDVGISLPTSNEVAINEIEANPFQPRINFDEEALQELAAIHQGIRDHTAYNIKKIRR